MVAFRLYSITFYVIFYSFSPRLPSLRNSSPKAALPCVRYLLITFPFNHQQKKINSIVKVVKTFNWSPFHNKNSNLIWVECQFLFTFFIEIFVPAKLAIVLSGFAPCQFVKISMNVAVANDDSRVNIVCFHWLARFYYVAGRAPNQSCAFTPLQIT